MIQSVLRPAARTSAGLGVCLVCLAALACAPAAPRSAPADEASVKPGINDRFLSDELDVEWAIGTFESESREIFTSRDAIVDGLGLMPGMRVADVGTGTGMFLAPISERVAPTGDVWAVDISPKLVDYVRERKEKEGLDRVRPLLGGQRSTMLPADSVDLTFLCDTYHHFEYPQSMLHSIREALSPGGRLVIVDFIRDPETSRQWVLDHVRAGRDDVVAEVEAAGFALIDEPAIEGLEENYMLRFRRT